MMSRETLYERNCRAHSRPIPVLPPVTMTTFPVRSVSFGGYRALARNWDLTVIEKNPEVRGGMSFESIVS